MIIYCKFYYDRTASLNETKNIFTDGIIIIFFQYISCINRRVDEIGCQ